MDEQEKSRNVFVSYGNRPSLASLVDRDRNQFVLLKTRTGGIAHPYLAEEVLDDVEKLEELINRGRKDSDFHQYVRLRGVWMDDAHGVASIFIQLLYDSRDKPAMTEQEIREFFHDGYGWYGGQSIVVEVSILEANTSSDYFWPVLDKYYHWVEEDYSFDTGIIEAVLSRMGKEVLPIFYDQVAKESVSKAEKLPKEIESEEDVDRIKKILHEEKSNMNAGQSKAFTVDFIETTYQSLNSNRKERLRQARTAFNTALILAGMGVVIILAGVILLFMGNISAGTITTVCGILPEIISLILFRINKETNDRLDQVTEHLNLLDKARLAIRFVEEINESSTKDKVIASVIDDLRSN